jgi:hypothetical protein
MDWDNQMKLNAMSRIGKEVWVNSRETGRPMLFGIVEDEVSILVDDAKHVIQRIRLADGVMQHGQKYGYKTGSFVIDQQTGDIKWGQYSQMLLEAEYRELLTHVKKKGWPIL